MSVFFSWNSNFRGLGFKDKGFKGMGLGICFLAVLVHGLRLCPQTEHERHAKGYLSGTVDLGFRVRTLNP